MKEANWKIRKEETFFKKNYSLSWQYLKESSNYTLVIISLLLLGAFIGLFYQPQGLIDTMRNFIKDVLDQTSGLNTWQMIIYILDNNLRSSFFALFFGIFLGIIPVFTALANGYILGFIAEKSVSAEGPLVLLRLVPHGIFEFPAIIIALALGIKLSHFYFITKEKSKAFSSFILSLLSFIVLLTISVLPVLLYFERSGITDVESMAAVPWFSSYLLFSSILIFILSNYLGSLILSKDERKIVYKEIIRRFENSLRVFLFVVLPLLVIAAIIEGFLIFALE
jgi:stage II sporulation protein M